LLAALAYRPDLLLLDEPSSGLDPIVRRDILGAIVRTIADQGRTVVFSSHLLAEVERVSDYVAMIQSGKILFCDTLDGILSRHCRITLRLEDSRAEPPEIAGALTWEGSGREWTAVCSTSASDARIAAGRAGAEVVEESALNLDEIFVAYAGGRRREGAAHE
jgi:ABC-2 type transport system ATP-binding protein